MKLKSKTYTVLNLLPSTVAIAPGAFMLSLGLNMLIAVFPLIDALSSAWFIDSALAMARGERAVSACVLPLIAVLAAKFLNFSRWEFDNYALQAVKRALRLHYRPAIAAKAASLDYRYIEDGKTWDLISRMTSAPEDKIHSILDGMIYLIQIVLSFAGVVILVAANVWWAALVLAASLAGLIAYSLHMGGKSYDEKAKIEREKRRYGELEKACLERDFSEERALFGYADALTDRYAQEYERAYVSYFRFQRVNAVSRAVLATLCMTAVAITAVMLAIPTARGEMSIGTMVAVVSALFSIKGQITGLQYCMSCIGEGRAYARELTEFSQLEETDGATDAPLEPPLPFESLEFKHVTFAYPNTERNVLDDFSLKLEKGRHYAFVGVNGAGKTTMTKLMTGLYRDFKGEILLNGRDIRTYDAKALKSLCSAVFQDFARYQVPARDSIAVGLPAREARVEDAVRTVGLRDAIAALPNGLDTPLGKIYEGGQDLSGGEWQRVAIARALVSGAPVRILDEPTAALDPMSESRFYEQFAGMSRGVTTLFISHRLGSTRLADRIFVIDGGRIAEEGTQAELLAAGGLFADMFEAQRSWYQ